MRTVLKNWTLAAVFFGAFMMTGCGSTAVGDQNGTIVPDPAIQSEFQIKNGMVDIGDGVTMELSISKQQGGQKKLAGMSRPASKYLLEDLLLSKADKLIFRMADEYGRQIPPSTATDGFYRADVVLKRKGESVLVGDGIVCVSEHKIYATVGLHPFFGHIVTLDTKYNSRVYLDGKEMQKNVNQDGRIVIILPYGIEKGIDHKISLVNYHGEEYEVEYTFESLLMLEKGQVRYLPVERIIPDVHVDIKTPYLWGDIVSGIEYNRGSLEGDILIPLPYAQEDGFIVFNYNDNTDAMGIRINEEFCSGICRIEAGDQLDISIYDIRVIGEKNDRMSFGFEPLNGGNDEAQEIIQWAYDTGKVIIPKRALVKLAFYWRAYHSYGDGFYFLASEVFENYYERYQRGEVLGKNMLEWVKFFQSQGRYVPMVTAEEISQDDMVVFMGEDSEFLKFTLHSKYNAVMKSLVFKIGGTVSGFHLNDYYVIDGNGNEVEFDGAGYEGDGRIRFSFENGGFKMFEWSDYEFTLICKPTTEKKNDGLTMKVKLIEVEMEQGLDFPQGVVGPEHTLRFKSTK